MLGILIKMVVILEEELNILIINLGEQLAMQGFHSKMQKFFADLLDWIVKSDFGDLKIKLKNHISANGR